MKPPANKTPLEIELAIVAKIREGWRTQEICKRFNMRDKTVYRIARSHNVQIPPSPVGRKSGNQYTTQARREAERTAKIPPRTPREIEIRCRAMSLSNWPSVRRFAW
jgi:transposase